MQEISITDIVVDGDTFIYQAGYASQSGVPKGEECCVKKEHAILCLDTAIESQITALAKCIGKKIDIAKWVEKGKLKFYLTSLDGSNFRYKIDPEYKANRREVTRPFHFENLRLHMVNKYKAEIVYNMEADDKISIEAHKAPYNTFILHEDKDIDQVPGTHGWFSPKSVFFRRPYFVEPWDKALGTLQLERSASGTHEIFATGEMRIAVQLLLGDTSDAIIKPKKGIGPKEVYSILSELYNDKEDRWYIFEIIRDIYIKYLDHVEGEILFEKNLRLLTLLSEENQIEEIKGTKEKIT